MAQHGKKYKQALNSIDRMQSYSPESAIDTLKQISFASFDETVEVHLRMGLDPRSADQQVRGIALLPKGLGKTVAVLVFAQGEGARIASDAGADYVGDDDIIKKIEDGWLGFDVSIATPDMMGKVGKLGKILGRRGLMPNPKSGTVVQAEDIPRAVNDARKGRVEFRLDRTGIIHVPIGKVSFETGDLLDNLSTLIEAIVKAKPSGAKGQYIRSAYITTTMGPGIKLDLRSTLSMTAPVGV